MNKKKLTNRMQALSELVIPGKACADIGTDHAYIPIYLLLSKICPYVILCDVRSGPLKKASKNLELAGIKDGFELRMGYGLKVLSPGEVSSVIIAGIGGELILNILSDDLKKANSFERIILQPRSRAEELRRFLSCSEFSISSESLVKEAGRISEIITVEQLPQGGSEHFESETDFLIPPMLFEKKDPLLLEFLDNKLTNAMIVAKNIEASSCEGYKKEFWQQRIKELSKRKDKL